MNELKQIIEESMGNETFVALVLTGPRTRGTDQCEKVSVRPILIRGKALLQFEYRVGRKATHSNLSASEAQLRVLDLIQNQFKQVAIRTTHENIQVTINRAGEAAITRRPSSERSIDLSHNRKKRYLLEEGTPIDFLVRLGVMSAEGKVIAAKYDKFRQINRFLEMVEDVVDRITPDPSAGQERPVRVVDFGCGKSYLTFALYHYLRTKKGMDARIQGLDLKSDVVSECNGIARDLGYTELEFQVGEIKSYRQFGKLDKKGDTERDKEGDPEGESEGDTEVDMVVSLHACDTATDDALLQAISWRSPVILSVPCCQHELFDKIRNEALLPMLKHGIIRERMAALITDSLRAQFLEASGYSVQMLEFIDIEHTPKNILIRAVRHSAAEMASERYAERKEQILEQYRAFRDFWHITPYIEHPTK